MRLSLHRRAAAVAETAAAGAMLHRAELVVPRAWEAPWGVGGAGIGGDACINETDLDIIGMTVPNLRWQAAVCGAACVGSMNDETLFLGCVDSCIQEDVPGLSLECTSCYGELAWCAGADCNTGCTNPIVNICAPDCTADSLLCPGYSTCLTELDRCAGRDSLDCLDDT